MAAEVGPFKRAWALGLLRYHLRECCAPQDYELVIWRRLGWWRAGRVTHSGRAAVCRRRSTRRPIVAAEVVGAVGLNTKAYVLGLLHDVVAAAAEGAPLPGWFLVQSHSVAGCGGCWVRECWEKLGWWVGGAEGRVTDLGLAVLVERGLGVG